MHDVVLLVEDDRAIRSALQDALQDEGLPITSVGSATEALALLKTLNPLPALILLDWNLPQMNGKDFLAIMKHDPKLSSIPVVMMSGESQLESKCAQLGVKGCLKKPVRLDEVLSMVARCIGPAASREAEDQARVTTLAR